MIIIVKGKARFVPDDVFLEQYNLTALESPRGTRAIFPVATLAYSPREDRATVIVKHQKYAKPALRKLIEYLKQEYPKANPALTIQDWTDFKK